MSSKLTFAISGISYLSVLFASFLLSIFYSLPRLYFWFLIPLVANFFVGYFAAELHTAVKVVITFLLLHIVIVVMVIGLLLTPLFYGTLKTFFYDTPLHSLEADPFALITLVILVYSVVNIILGVIASSIGIIVRSYTGRLKKLLPAKE